MIDSPCTSCSVMFWLPHAPAAWLLENTLISHRKTVADALRFYVDHGLIVAEQPPAMPTAERIEATASRMISQQARSNEDLVRRFVDNGRIPDFPEQCVGKDGL